MTTIVASPAELHAIEKLREEELEEARSIQSVMLPAESLRTSGVRISHAFQRVTEVGRDFLDYFELTDGVLGLYLGGCVGQGVAGGDVCAAGRRHVARSAQGRAMPFAGVVDAASAIDHSGNAAAACSAMFDPRTRMMKITCAGMPGPFHLTTKGCRALEIQGIPPGLFDPSIQYKTV
jgi:serine phosphatase RsbU (regulator of sigma subunit)